MSGLSRFVKNLIWTLPTIFQQSPLYPEFFKIAIIFIAYGYKARMFHLLSRIMIETRASCHNVRVKERQTLNKALFNQTFILCHWIIQI